MPVKQRHLTAWGTDDELTFLDGLGRYKWIGRKQALLFGTSGRAVALEKYLMMARRRERWDGVDKALIIGHATVSLDYELAQQRLRPKTARTG